MRLILEQRYLFDGSIAHVAHHHAHHGGIDAHEGTAVADAIEAVADAPPAAGISRPEPGHTDDRQAATLADGAAAGSLTAIVFVDSRVADWKELTASLPDNVGVVVISPDRNGMDVVSRVLAHQQDLQSVNFLTYGQPGAAELGNSTISEATVAADSRQVTGWGDALAPGGQILFWGCDVGAGVDGRALVDDLHTLTGADIAASTDRTGLATLGGNWTLEQTAGMDQAQVASPFSTQAEANYDYALDGPVADVALSGQASALLGGTFTDTITFKNSGGSPGYTPYVELFAPTNSKQYTPLESGGLSMVNGSGSTNLPYKMALLTTGPGNTIGATNPLTGTWVAAPTGFAVGDTMYVAQLPFGSYTPGQPPITIQATFLTDTSNESIVSRLSSDGGLVNIAAAGGYALGDSPTGSTPIASSFQTAGTSLDLLDVTSQIQTAVGEDESPTGPDYVQHYQLTLTAAPITNGNPISGGTVTIALPEQVIFKGGTVDIGGQTVTPTFTGTPGKPGGTLNLALTNAMWATGAPLTIDIPVYVDRTDASDNPVLEPGSVVDPTTIAAPTESYASVTWTPPTGSFDKGYTKTFGATVTSADTAFDAKAFAIQESATDETGGGKVMPDDVITHTIAIENSDFYASNNLNLAATLSDGQTILGTTVPLFSYTDINGDLHQNLSLGNAGGSTGSYWSYTRNSSTGVTTATFDIAQMLAAQDLPAMRAGSSASLTYGSQASETFLVTSLPVTEGNQLTSSVNASVDLLDPSSGQSLSETAGDTSGTTLAVAQGGPSLQVVAINGDTGAAANPIKAGDYVTYQATYNLTSNTFDGLDLASYLPLPLVNTADPTASGSATTTQFTQATGQTRGTYIGNAANQAGTYILDTTPASAATDVTIASTAAVNSAANSVDFALLSNNTMSETGKTVTVLFTLRATDAPFADGLTMTSQEQSTFVYGSDPTHDTQQTSVITQSTVAEPMAELKTGIVSVMTPDSHADTVSYTGSADPTAIFSAAGSTGNIFKTQPTPTSPDQTLGAIEDLDASQANAGDTVRIATSVQNSGSATMYGLTIAGTLPAGFAPGDVRNFQITYPDGSAVPLSDSTAYFTAAGLKIPASATESSLAAGQVLTVTYDLTLPATAIDTTLSPSAKIVNFWNTADAAAAGTSTSGFVTSRTQTSDLGDGADITTIAPSITQSLGPSSIRLEDGTTVEQNYNGMDAAGADHGSNTVVAGEQRQTTITVQVPQGTLTNAGDVSITVTLPKGVTYVPGSQSVPGYSVASPTPTSNGDGTTTLVFDLGSSVTNTNTNGTPKALTLTYTANYTNGMDSVGTDQPLTAALNYTPDGTGASRSLAATPVQAIEQEPSLSEQIASTLDNQKAAYSGETVTYTATITNTGLVHAYDVTVNPTNDTPTVLQGVSYSFNGQSGLDTAGLNSAIKQYLGTTGLAPGAEHALTYQIIGKIASNQPATTTAKVEDTVTSNSVPNGPGGTSYTAPEVQTATAHDALVAVGAPTATSLSIVGEANDTTLVSGQPLSLARTGSAINVVPGDYVTLRGIATLPEGSNGNVTLTFDVPSNLTVDMSATAANSNVKILLVSPDGQMTSTTLESLLGTGSSKSSTVQTIGGLSAAQTTAATQGLPLSADQISYADGKLTINLGTVTDNAGQDNPSSVGTYGSAIYVVVDVNAWVNNDASNKAGNQLIGETLSVSTDATASQPVTTPSVTQTVVEPQVTLTKTVQGITYDAGTGTYTVTYVDTLTNTSTVTAYGVTLNDPFASGESPYGTATLSNPTPDVDGTKNSSTPQLGSSAVTGRITLEGGQSEAITYHVQLPASQLGADATTATVTWLSLQNVAAGANTSGAVDQSRDGSGNPAVDDYSASVTTGLAYVAGQVWQDLGYTPNTYASATDTALGNVKVKIVEADGHGTYDTSSQLNAGAGLLTAADGTYATLIPFYGATPSSTLATVTLPSAGQSGLPGGETLVYNPHGTTAAATATVSPDSTGGHVATHVDMSFALPDTAPTWAVSGATTGWGGTTPITDQNGRQTISLGNAGTLAVSDAEIDRLVGDGAIVSANAYAGTVLTVQRYSSPTTASPSATDGFGAAGNATIANGAVSVGGTQIGTYDQAKLSTGILQVTFGGNATAASIATLLQNLTYTYTAANNDGWSNLAIGATLSDGNTTSVGGNSLTGHQGTGGAKTSAPLWTYVDIPPASPAGFTTAFTEPNNNTPVLPTYLDNSLTLQGTGSIQKAVIQVTNALPEDVLAAPTLPSGISIDTGNTSYDSAAYTYTLTLTGTVGTPLSSWQTALRAITYADSSDTPTTTPRNVTMSLYENGVATPVTTTGTVSVTAVDDSPVLTTTTLLPIQSSEDAATPVSGVQGTSLATLIGFDSNPSGPRNVQDPDLANDHDGSATGTLGIAITNVDTSKGTWYYSTDGGTNWATMPAIPAGSAFDLTVTPQTQVYFQPTVANWNGTISNALTFRAWDQSDAVHSGTVTTLPTASLGQGTNTPSAAYSANAQSVSLNVAAVNDAPTITGTPVMPAETVNSTTETAPGSTVASLFTSVFSDATDNATLSTANTLAGIAITGDAADPATQGTWHYSTDGGANWTALPSNLSATNALVLPTTAQLQFVPVAGFSGKPGGLTVHVVDNSGQSNNAAPSFMKGTTPVYGSDIGTTVYTGVDVSTAIAGTVPTDAASISADSVVLTIPVYDAPTMTGAPQAPTESEDTTAANAPHATVTSVLGPVFSYPTRNSLPDPIGGMAITGDAANATTQGTWRYSTDGGASWTVLPSDLSSTNALVLGSNVQLDFVPVANFNGQPGALTVQAIDSSNNDTGAAPVYTDDSGTPVYGADLAGTTTVRAGVDVNNAGGTSSISATTAPLTIQVAPVNDAPIVVAGKETETLAAGTEDAAAPPSATVHDLFNPSFNDAADQQQAAGGPTASTANTLAGVAITGNTANATTQGSWQYSTDGTHWTAIATDLSAGNALVLSQGVDLRFDPVANFNGQPPGLTATLIDSSSNSTGAAPLSGSGGSAVYGADLLATPMALAGVDVTVTGTTTSLSTASVTLDTSVAQLNDAPIVVAGKETETLAAGIEDAAAPPSATVHDLFNPSFSDAADQQQAAGGPTASTANTLAGVAITGNTANATTQGSWQYSTDGIHWTAIATDLSAGNALVLSQGVDLRFDPVANFNGQPPGLTATLIDSSSNSTGAAPLSGSGGSAVYGADLLATPMALAGVNATVTGTTTSLSATSVTLDISVAQINDAPTMAGVPLPMGEPEDPTGPAVMAGPVALLLGPVFSDATDQQKAAGGSTASVANTLAGMAITGDAANPATQGTWRYSTDGGANWTALPSDLSSTNALVLGSNVQLDFVPVANFNGQPGALTVQAIDSSNNDTGAAPVYTDGGTPVYGADLAGTTTVRAGVDVNNAGGTSSISATTAPLTIQVAPVNDAPIVVAGKETETLAAGIEDETAPPSATVHDLFNPSFNDAADQQQAAGGSTASTPNTLAGVAITGNTANATTQGSWQYSTDGIHWTAIATDLSAGNALVLSQGVDLRFDPVANFNGQPPGLTATLIDSSSNSTGAAPLSGSGGSAVYGADLLATPMALAGVDATVTGATTSLSATSVTLDTSVAQLNDAPTMAGVPTMPSEPEDTTASRAPGSTVASLLTPVFTDQTDQQQSASNSTGSTANSLAGMAITGDAANPATQGTWRYSTDGGASWTVLPSDLSSTNALVLGSNVQLDFVPVANFNGQPGALTVQAIDSSNNDTGAAPVYTDDSGTPVYGADLAGTTTVRAGVDVNNAGGTSSISATTAPLTIQVAPVNDAPIVVAGKETETLAAGTEDAAAPPSATVHDLFNPSFNDAADQQQAAGGPTASTANTLAGVAITGNTANATTQGSWQYSTDGTHWTAIATDLSAGNALVLSQGVDLRFDPVANFNGQPPGLTATLIDSSSNSTGAAPLSGSGGSAVYGADLLATPMALAGVDVTVTGTTTSLSTASVTLDTSVAQLNDAPIVVAGKETETLAAGTEDAAAPPSATVHDLFNPSFNDATDQQQAAGGSTASTANTLAGVAITGNTANATTQGSWQYSTDGIHWTAIATDLSAGNALVLSQGVDLRFDPVANFNGQPPGLTATLIDSSSNSTGAAPLSGSGGSAVYGADLLATPMALAGVNATVTGTTTSLSAISVTLDTSVAQVNDAPTMAGVPTMPSEPEDTTASRAPGSTVASLLTSVFTDQTDQQQSASNSTGSTANSLAGMAITGDAANATTQGTWRYSTDGGASWTVLPSDLSSTNALVLGSNVQLDFVPVANFNGQPGALTVQAIDSSNNDTGAAQLYTDDSGNPVYGADLAGTTTARAGVDVNNAGGTSSISATTAPLTIQVAPVNDAPIVVAGKETETLAAGIEDETAPPSATVHDLFNPSFNDATDQQPGSTANTLAGVAITADTATPDQGTWKYSTDNGRTWTALPSDLSPTNALVLPQSAQLLFDPAPNYNGQPGGLTATLIDSSTDVPVYTDANGNPVTGAQITTAQTGVDVSHPGTNTALSVASVDLNTSVAPVNDAPIATGSATLSAGTEDTTGPAQTVQTLFGGNFSDTVDQQPGSTANTLAGVAITADTATPDQGTWKYSTDNGRTWTALPSDLSPTNALVLPQSAQLQFDPASNYNGQPGGLTATLIDSSTDVPVYTDAAGNPVTGAQIATATTAQTGVDVSRPGTNTALSVASVDLNTSVAPVNDAPIATGSATLTAGTGDTTGAAHTVQTLFGGNFSDTVDQQPGSTANTLAGVAITGDTATASQGTWRYSTDGGKSWQSIDPATLSPSSAIILPATAQLSFQPASNFSGSPGKLTVALIETGSTLINGTDMSRADVSGLMTDPTSAVSNTTVDLATMVANTRPQGVPALPGATGSNGESPASTVTSSVDSSFNTIFQRGVAAAHQNWIFGTAINHFIVVDQQGSTTVPMGAFLTDDGTESQLELTATLTDGSPLPDWLSFDSRSRIFTGTAPEEAFGSLDIKVRGRDLFGHEAEVGIHIVIGHQHQLLDLQAVPQAIHQTFDTIQTTVNRLMLDPHLASFNDQPSTHSQGKPSLRSQLRHLGAKAHQRDARALLDKQTPHHALL